MTPSSRPIIGLTCDLAHNAAGTAQSQLSHAYTAAIQYAGGMPLIIPVNTALERLAKLLTRLDGVLLTGGGDLDPHLFGGEDHPRVYGISPERDGLELALVREALATRLPLLAICRGVQALNVAFGGTLHTHIPDQLSHGLKHDYFPGYPRDHIAHTVSLKCGSLLHEIFGEDEIPVNSLHHQGIDRVGDGLEAIGFAPDGLVESVVVSDVDFAVGVQWHPECLPEDPRMRALFEAFVAACA